MNWCGYCSREETSAFCVKCGRQVTKSDQVRHGKWGIWVMIVVALVIILGGSFYTLRVLSSPERTVDRFREAMMQEDYDEMATMVTHVNPILSHKSEIVSFTNLIKNHPEQRMLLIQDLERQAKALKDHEYVKPNKDLLIQMKLVEEGKTFLIFNNYAITPVPIYVEVYTQFPDTTLFVNEEEAGEFNGTAKKTGPFIPGFYQLKAELENEGYKMRGEAEVELIYPGETEQIDLPVNGAYVSPNSNYEDAVLFINGKGTGNTVGETGEIGPFPIDGSVVMHVEKTFEVGVVKSPSVRLEGEDVYLAIDYSEPEPVVIEKEVPSETTEVFASVNQSEPIIQAVNTYLRDWINAYEHLDTSYFTNLTPELYSYFEDRFVSVRQNNGAFTGEVLEAAFDMDSLVIHSSGKVAEVDVLITMDSANHEPGDQNVRTEVTSSAFHYKLVKSNGNWLINSREEVEHIDLTNAVIFP
ncbi:hypothetical protein ABFG93_14425 [Pseudalkalibacillus hwajinpoensis]|uniref:zinc ribbon domain-containing protein n=1 Tax=Guptibacillus hwajinpoensis TaxID=208199 RepID=UPI00325A95AA